MIIAAFDLSLTQTGFAIRDSSGARSVGTIRPPSKGMERLAFIRNRVLQLAAGATLVVIEGYSYGSKGAAILNIAELGGVIRLALHERNAGPQPAYVEIPPPVVKKYATGHGNAAKEEVLAAAIRRLDYQGANHNESDALWMLHAAAEAFGFPWADIPQAQAAALAKIDWTRSEVR